MSEQNFVNLSAIWDVDSKNLDETERKLQPGQESSSQAVCKPDGARGSECARWWSDVFPQQEGRRTSGRAGIEMVG